jgi:hypothetical protein
MTPEERRKAQRKARRKDGFKGVTDGRPAQYRKAPVTLPKLKCLEDDNGIDGGKTRNQE